jgi:hypothetical protein
MMPSRDANWNLAVVSEKQELQILPNLRFEATVAKTVQNSLEPQSPPIDWDFCEFALHEGCWSHTLLPHRSIQFTPLPEFLELYDSLTHPHHFGLVLVDKVIKILDSLPQCLVCTFQLLILSL